MRGTRGLLTCCVAIGVALGALSVTTGAVAADESTAPQTVVVDDAQLRWAVNDESNNRAFAPGTTNFLSAGEVPDPGRGGQRIVSGVWQGTTVQAWRARVGEARIEKLLDGRWGPATFAGLSQTTTGAAMTGTSGPFSGHQVVIDGGSGVVDREAGTATISWDGSFSVVFYSGMTFFTVTDPQLRVTPSGATLTARLAGYASSMEDQTEWRPVAAQRVVVADLPVPDLSSADGFTVTPRYLGVTHQAPAGGTPQLRSGPAWGSFPAEFVSYVERLGSSSYWYSSGGSADAHKVAAPVTVSYDADRAVAPPTTPAPAGDTDVPRTTVGPAPPPTTVGTTPGSTTSGDGGAAGGAGSGPVTRPGPVPGTGPTAPGAGVTRAAVPTAAPQAAYAAQTSPVSSSRVNGSDHRWTWWLGSVLLLLAAATSVQALHTRRTTPSRGPR